MPLLKKHSKTIQKDEGYIYKKGTSLANKKIPDSPFDRPVNFYQIHWDLDHNALIFYLYKSGSLRASKICKLYLPMLLNTIGPNIDLSIRVSLPGPPSIGLFYKYHLSESRLHHLL